MIKSNLTQNQKSSRTWLRVVIAALIVLSIFFRFVNLDRKVYWHDETLTSLTISGYTWTEMIQQVFNGREIGVDDLQKYQHTNAERNIIDSIKSLAEDFPEHPPLYYLIARTWAQLFGSSVAAIRSLSAAISLLTFPCIYWLCIELFESPLVSWIAVTLLAVSPFQLLYAQEAREYSLWTVAILLLSTSLLRAVRIEKEYRDASTRVSERDMVSAGVPVARTRIFERDLVSQRASVSQKVRVYTWGIYAVTVAIGLYIYPFSALVVIAQGIYVLAIAGFRLSKTLAAFAIASGLGIALFAPWLWIIVTNPGKLPAANWTSERMPLLSLMQTWVGNCSRIFIDFNLDSKDPLLYTVIPIVSISTLIGYSIYFLCRKTTKKTCLFILLLIGVPALFLILPDLVLGGRRSSVSRYLLPCYLGIQLAVAYLLATQVSKASSSQRGLWQAIAVILILTGVVSCATISQAEVWWNKKNSHNNPQTARIINQATHPLLISSDYNINPGEILSLSHLLQSKVRLRLVVEPNIPNIPDGFSDVFAFNPSKTLRKGLEKQNFKVKLVEPSKARLWKIISNYGK